MAGLLVAGGVHATKAVARPAINVSTAGIGGPVVSVVEDAVAFVTSVLAVLAPLLMVVFVVAVVAVAYRRVSRWRAARSAAVAPTA
jgi:cbb3-type cytochrome oxidase subunit 3